MTELPFISLVILTWNSRSEITRLMRSIEKTDYPRDKYEVIVVDNGSNDDTVEVVNRQFPRVKIIGLKKNYGIWVRNYGFKKARGEIVINLDSDAVLPRKDTLRKVVEKVMREPNLGILGVKVFNTIRREPELSPMDLNFYTGVIRKGDSEKETTKATWVPLVLAAIPRTTFKKVGYIYKAFAYGEDLNFCLRVREKGLKVVYWPGVEVYHHRTVRRADVDFKVKYHHYYKAIFRNIYEYGSWLQAISVTLVQLIGGSIFGLIVRRRYIFKARWWGWWWNVRNSSFETKLFIVALIMGSGLRIAGLSWHDFWFDEAFTYQIARLPIKMLLAAVMTDNNPPLYYLLIHWILKLSQNEVVLRIPSLVANLAAVMMTVNLGTKLGSRRAGLIAATLLAVSPLAIYTATEARLHSWGMVIVLSTVYVFLKTIKSSNWKKLIGLTGLGIVGVYTQYYIGLLWPVFILIAWFTKAKIKVWKWVGSCLVVMASLVPWLVVSAGNDHSGCACPRSELSLPAAMISPILGGVGEMSLGTFGLLAWPILGLFSITSLLVLWGFFKGAVKAGWWQWWYWGPLGILSITGWLVPIFSPKAFATFSPLFFLILGWGWFRSKYWMKWPMIAVGLVGSVSLIQLINPFFSGTRLAPIYEIVKRREELPIMHTSVISYYSLDYYAQGGRNQKLITENPLSMATVKYVGGIPGEIEQGVDKLWLVDSEKWAGQSYKDKKKKIFEDFRVLEQYQAGDIKVWLLHK